MFESIPHSKFIANFESYLMDSIDAESDWLLELYKFHVIDSAQMRAIESRRTLKERNKELLSIISKTTPKSFNLFLTALVLTGRSNLTGNMRFTNSTPDTLTNEDVNENKNVDEEQVVSEINNENSSVEIHMSTNIEHDKSRSPENISFSSDEPAQSVDMLQPFRNEEYAEIEYTLEDKKRFDLQLKTIDSLSSITSDVIKNQALLPEDIKHRLFLKMLAMHRDLPLDMSHGSRHFYSLLGYLSSIHNQEVLSTHHMEKLSIEHRPGRNNEGE